MDWPRGLSTRSVHENTPGSTARVALAAWTCLAVLVVAFLTSGVCRQMKDLSMEKVAADVVEALGA